MIEDDNEMEEQHMSGEEAVQKHEDNKVIMGKKEYMVCARGMLRISVAWSLEARYYSGFPPSHLFF